MPRSGYPNRIGCGGRAGSAGCRVERPVRTRRDGYTSVRRQIPVQPVSPVDLLEVHSAQGFRIGRKGERLRFPPGTTAAGGGLPRVRGPAVLAKNRAGNTDMGGQDPSGAYKVQFDVPFGDAGSRRPSNDERLALIQSKGGGEWSS